MPLGKRLQRKPLTAAQASRRPVAFDTPTTPPCPNRPSVAHLSNAPGPTAQVRPRCFQPADHRSSSRTRLASEGFSVASRLSLMPWPLDCAWNQFKIERVLSVRLRTKNERSTGLRGVRRNDLRPFSPKIFLAIAAQRLWTLSLPLLSLRSLRSLARSAPSFAPFAP